MHGAIEEAETGRRGSHWNGEPKPKPTEKGRGNAGKTKTRIWSDVVKILKIEDKLETPNSDMSWNELEAADSEEEFDSEELNQLKAK